MASSSTAPAPQFGVRGLVCAVAAASAVGTIGALCLLEVQQRRRRLRPPSRKQRRDPPATLGQKASSQAPSGVLPLRERLTVLLTTSPLARHPCADLIDEVLGSFQLADGLADCDLILVCDGYRDTNAEGLPFKESKFRSGIVDADAAANYEAYKATLRERQCSRDGATPSMQVLELPSRHGFGFAVKAALDLVHTPYVLVVQHDRPFVRRCNVPRLLAAMEADPERLKYVGLPTTTTVGHQYHVLSKYGIRLPTFEADRRGLLMLPLIQWYDSTHICEVEHYRNFIFGPEQFVVKGGFIEDKLGQVQLAAIRKDGVQAAHPRFGTFLACGSGFCEACVAHLDGREPLNDSNFRFSDRGDDVQIAVDHAIDQETDDVSRSAKSGETAPASSPTEDKLSPWVVANGLGHNQGPISVEMAAARAAEAARIRAAEAVRPQSHTDTERGRQFGQGSELKLGRYVEPRPVISLVAKEAWQEFYVDNTQLKANTPGLGFRMSKQLEDRAKDDSSVPWGSTLMGVDLGDGWVRVQIGRFLPTHLGGVRVLSAADGLHRDSALSPPQPSQPVALAARPRQQDPTGRGMTVRAPPLSMGLAVPGPLMQNMPGWGAGPGWGPGPLRPMGYSAQPFIPTVAGHNASQAKPKTVGPQQTQQKAQAKALVAATVAAWEPAKVSNSPRDGARIWEYVDPKGRIQGPFRQAEMLHWHNKGYFPKDLPIRCTKDDEFVPFEQMFPLRETATPFKTLPNRSPPSAG